MSKHILLVDCLDGVELPEALEVGLGETVFDRAGPDAVERHLAELDPDSDVVMAFVGDSPSVQETIRKIRRNRRFARTRIYVVGAKPAGRIPGWAEDLDVEDFLSERSLGGTGLEQVVGYGARAYRALLKDDQFTEFYLDSTFNKIFDWFETTRWSWSEIDLDSLDPDGLTEQEIDFLTEAAIIEFGTLPGAHNFLREWEGETSFSSWALLWGAEEARHSLVQARYLDRIGVKIRSKHALYKREPYPIGGRRAGTLMMNIISEARASALYTSLASEVSEPVIKRIWKLLSRDEARHARAFFTFAQQHCDARPEEQLAALKMAYVWLADRGQGIKHPAGLFYPHSTSTGGLRRIEAIQAEATDHADAKVLAMVRRLAEDDSIESTRDLKRKLRALI